jgi:hypothetical protein
VPGDVGGVGEVVGGGVATATSTSSQFGPPRVLATRTFTLPVCVPIVSTPLDESIVQPSAAPRIEKCRLAVDGNDVALI